MSKAIVIYYTRSGTTRKMAETITEELEKRKIAVDILTPDQVEVNKLLDYDLIIIGTPTYYGTMAAEIKKLLDDSIRLHGRLDGKLGGAFASSANVAGGNETAILSILSALLIHGMLVKGMADGSHYGPVAIKSFDDRAEKECRSYANQLADYLKT
ncbi:MAG: flavodoxin domain-containing protein [Candidatus Atribacteria bacterium]|nr:flavodoxin domain-containing protein [Candidatus Atribacteria bacterium]